MRKILLVEDNETIILGLKYSLEQEGFEVEVAKSVTETKKKLENGFDLYLLDISLPDGNGFNICKEIKSKKDVPVIFLTARDEETNVVLGLDIGALEYKILLMLFTNQNKLITRDQLLDKIWDFAGNFVNDNTLTVYIKRIRKKIGDKDGKIIQTVRGIGYRIGD